ncbi:hypothetical protein BDZ85DRAFT_312199 [Elsinoe ampelina]|uniref:Uncharacterized protein n=1 Tax=Elsinoe ampelina TaxID=302913 RepID=A0A6A6FXP9_9PEZI|nr:hypothetical protein BDZ85DRAFT_312199 [Elsinoe ampelina]
MPTPQHGASPAAQGTTLPTLELNDSSLATTRTRITHPNYLSGYRRYLVPFVSDHEDTIGCNLSLISHLVRIPDELILYDLRDLEKYLALAEDYMHGPFPHRFREVRRPELTALPRWCAILRKAVQEVRQAPNARQRVAFPALCPWDEFPDDCREYWRGRRPGVVWSRDLEVAIGDQMKVLQGFDAQGDMEITRDVMRYWIGEEPRKRLSDDEMNWLEDKMRPMLMSGDLGSTQVDVRQVAGRYGIGIDVLSEEARVTASHLLGIFVCQDCRTPFSFRHVYWTLKLVKGYHKGFGEAPWVSENWPEAVTDVKAFATEVAFSFVRGMRNPWNPDPEVRLTVNFTEI